MSASATCASHVAALGQGRTTDGNNLMEGRTNDGGDDAELLTILSTVPMSRAAAPLPSALPLAATADDDAYRAEEIHLAPCAINWGGIGGGAPHLEPGWRFSTNHCSPHEILSGGRGMVWRRSRSMTYRGCEARARYNETSNEPTPQLAQLTLCLTRGTTQEKSHERSYPRPR
jgi:hypothetical protein